MKNVILLVILFALGNAQNHRHLESDIPSSSSRDEIIIKNHLQILMYSARLGNVKEYLRRTMDNISTGVMFSDNDMFDISDNFELNNIQIDIENNNAKAAFEITDISFATTRQATISFIRKNGIWKINKSAPFLEVLLRKSSNASTQTQLNSKSTYLDRKSSTQSKNRLNSSLTYSMGGETYILSPTSLIKKHVIYSNSQTINQTTTQNQIGKKLIDSPTSGKILALNGGSHINIVADAGWHRIIIGDYSAQKIISYGDNPGDIELNWASGICMDKYGNIFLLANQPREVIRLKYNESNQTITFINKVPIYRVQYPVDMCLDDNFTPDNISDDSFWLADAYDNSILQFSWNGLLIGKYNKIKNQQTGEIINIVNPTKILVGYNIFGTRNINVIDSYKKRIIIVPDIVTLNNNTITGTIPFGSGNQTNNNIMTITFTSDASLNSIANDGIFSESGLWVSDEQNKMFHIFDRTYGNGYLGSVKNVLGGTEYEWEKPQFAATTFMSNSAQNLSYELMTMDQWDLTRGINSYLFGCDIVKPELSFVGNTVYIYGNITHTLNITTQIYNPAGVPVYSSGSALRIVGKDLLTIFTVLSTIGKYRARFGLTPSGNTYYGYYEQPIRYIDIYFAAPLEGILSGPSSGYAGTQLTWNPNITSGSGEFGFTWKRKYYGSSTWEIVGTEPTLTLPMNTTSYEIQVEIHDLITKTQLVLSKYISSITTSGTLTTNESWEGTINLTGSVVVPSGLTLTIQPGTVILLPSGASLNVYGVLNAVGTSSSKITFSSTGATTAGSWGNIYISGSGANNSTITHANIQHGTEIDVINASNVTIEDCSITNSSSHGINFSGSTTTGAAARNSIINTNVYHGIVVQNGANIRCDQNYINKSNSNRQGAGILFSGGGTGTVYQNEISGWNWGVGAVWGSSPHFSGPYILIKNNHISYCSYGVYAYQQSFPVITPNGSSSYYWKNSIHNNTYKNVYFTSGGTIYARNTYWGGTPTSTMFTLGSGCSIDTYGWLSNNPWGQVTEAIFGDTKNLPQINSINKEQEINAYNIQENIFEGIRLRRESGNKSAKDFFKSYIGLYPSDQAAYVEMYNCFDMETADDIIKMFSNLPQKASKEHKLLLSYMFLKQNNIASAKDVNNQIIYKNENNLLGIRAKLNNFYIALYHENDIEEATKLFHEIANRSDLTTSVEIELAQMALTTFPEASAFQIDRLRKGNITELSTPDVYELSQNHPNPFNPVTTISYALPQDGLVMLKIYDALGREVSTLVNGFKQTGRYSASFDASKLSSGVYIYKLVSGKYTATKKMMLVK